VNNITYTFIDDITYTAYDTAIVIMRDNIIMDGNGYTLQGTGVGGHGIDLYGRSNVTIWNIKVEKFNYGIYLSGSSNSSIVECNITENSNGAGISIYESPNNRIVGCNLTNNGYNVLLSSSSNNILKNNSMTNERYYNLAVWGDELSHFVHDMEQSNTVNSKPICYWINRRDMEVPSDVGYVALINSTMITVEGLELKNNGQCILLAYTTNSRISNNNLTDNKYGISFFSSSLNIVSGNNISGNGDNGIYLGHSSNNAFYSNKIAYSGGGLGISTGGGARLKSSHNNTFFGNTMKSNQGSGISLEDSSENNNIHGNNIVSNGWSGISLVASSNNNAVFENQIINNSACGINIYASRNNTFYHNNFVNNTDQVVIRTSGYANFWDDGYPSGGNYWSDYAGVDADGDGIGDAPYVIDENNTDRYPLMSSWIPPEHDLVVSITAPASLSLGGSSSLKATVTNEGLNDEASVELSLLINGSAVDSTTIPLLQSGSSYTLTYLWNPTAKGTYNVIAYVTPVLGETSTENNQETKFVTVSAPIPLEVQVGVKAGDWIKVEYTVSGWPSGQPYPEWLKVEFLSVEGTNATVRVTMHMSDGTEQNATVPVIIGAGGGEAFGLSGFVIPANLTIGDSVYITGYGNVTIAGETTGTHAGASRTVVYASISQYGTQLTYYWDKQTGVMVEASTTSGGVTATAKATETNMWQPELFGLDPILLYSLIIVTIVIVAAVAFLAIRRKKKPPEEVENPQS